MFESGLQLSHQAPHCITALKALSVTAFSIQPGIMHPHPKTHPKVRGQGGVMGLAQAQLTCPDTPSLSQSSG